MGSHMTRPASVHDHVPPPHLPQRHFARRPDMDFGLSSPSESSITAGSKGYYCGFDSLENANAGTSSAANNVVLVGTQGGLDVYRLLRQRSDIVGRLEGLRGAVVDAKILPWTERDDPFYALRPLVLCVLHGPTNESEAASDDGPPKLPSASVSFQTTVEIFSLASAQSLCCIYESPLISAPAHAPPTPIGNLSIAAEGRFITVVSGVSGEVHVFSPYTHSVGQDLPPVRCIAKFWTTASTSSPSNENGPAKQHEDYDTEPRHSTCALSQRWLVVRPPLLSSAQISLHGTPLLSPGYPDPPGVSTHVSPPPPSISCGVDAPFSDTLFDRMTKQATQEIRKGAQWVGEQGKQVWNAYWGRYPPPRGDASQHTFQAPTQIDAALFPPTHAQNNESQQIHVEPALVSIIDLHRLLENESAPTKGVLTPLSTFSLFDGCSFMSFAPSGLSLLITNQIGDACTIWDLTRITNGRASPRYSSGATSMAPYISVAARFGRQTPSVVTEVAWSAQGNRVAILTQRGTIHLHEVPSANFRALLPSVGASSPTNNAGLSPSSSPQGDAPVSGFVSSVRARLQTLPGIALRTPSNTNSLGATVSSASAYARHTGRRAIKQGVSMATDTALKIRHHEETKIRLQPKQHGLRASCMRWLSGRECGLIATVFDGKVRLHSVKSNHYLQGKRTVLYLTASRRPVGESTLQPISRNIGRAGGDNAACARAGPHGFWALNKANAMKRIPPSRTKPLSTTIVQDKDTNPTYLPFHRAPQVNLFTFDEAGPVVAELDSEDAWIFGMPIASTTRITCQQVQPEEEYAYGMTAGDMEDLLTEMPESSGGRTELEAM